MGSSVRSDQELGTTINQKLSGAIGKPVKRLYYKRPIHCLASSKILTPHPRECVPPAFVRGEDILAAWRGEWEVNILEDARQFSVLYICKYLVGKPIRHLSEAKGKPIRSYRYTYQKL